MRGLRHFSIIAFFALLMGIAGNANAMCDADINGDGQVDSIDWLALLSGWGQCSGPCPADINGDGQVDSIDWLALLSGWGECPPEICPYDCMDGFGCVVILNGISHPEYVCDGEMMCCEIADLGPCPHSCVQTPQECSLSGGTQYQGFDCSGGICCEIPPRDPCSYDCVPGMFDCMLSGGMDRLEFECASGTCCEIP